MSRHSDIMLTWDVWLALCDIFKGLPRDNVLRATLHLEAIDSVPTFNVELYCVDARGEPYLVDDGKGDKIVATRRTTFRVVEDQPDLTIAVADCVAIVDGVEVPVQSSAVSPEDLERSFGWIRHHDRELDLWASDQLTKIKRMADAARRHIDREYRVAMMLQVPVPESLRHTLRLMVDSKHLHDGIEDAAAAFRNLGETLSKMPTPQRWVAP